MRPHDSPTATISKGLAAVFAAALCTSCVPSFPPDFGGGALDRSQPCLQETADGETIEWPGFGLGEDGELGLNACGYPEGNPDEDGEPVYGFEVNDVFDNLVLYDCEGNLVQIAQYLPQFGLANGTIKGVVFSVGALWCMPCRDEAIEWAADFIDEYPDIQFLQGLDEGPVGNDSVSPEQCAGWSTTNAQDKFPILYDPTPQALQTKIEGANSGSGLPFTMILDTNANVRLKEVGGKLDPDILRDNLDILIAAADPNDETDEASDEE